MSTFKKFFGSKKNDASNAKAAAKQLEETRDLLTKKSEFLEKKIEEELNTARRYGMKNKKMALKALARKKGYENQLQKIDNTILIVESQLQALDNAGMNLEVFRVLKNTSESMKGLHKNMKLDNVQDIMDDIAEQREIAQEISDAISNPATFGLEIDDDELARELEALQAEDLERQMLDVGPLPDVPSIPSHEIAGPSTVKPQADTSEKDLEELMAWAE
ncbi:Charged multivesicular body protein 4b [Clonorchis sinensis]|uniref:Charged multivesicular body protein 4b n=3 Tax=Opisthorchiidae TaxID=6196 RepID=A0A419PJJ0_CLOSI|nr:Charged multivesicular body protein 4b [Clonorchis sinensis]